MSNVKFYNLNVSSLVYLGYADSNFVDWKSGKAYSLECINSEISLPLVATHTTMENITGKHLEWLEVEVPVVLNVQKYKNLRLPGVPGRNLTETIYGVLQERSALRRSVSPLATSYVTEGCVRFNLISNRSYEQLLPGILWFGGSNLSIISKAITEVNVTFGHARPGTILIPTELKSENTKTNLSIVIPAANLGLNYEDDPLSHVFQNITTLHFIPDCKNETTKSLCVTCESFFELLKMFSASPCEIPTQQSFSFSTRCSILCHQTTIPKNNLQTTYTQKSRKAFVDLNN